MVFAPVLLILVQEPGGKPPFRGRRPGKIAPESGGKRRGAGRFIHDSQLLVLVRDPGILGGLGLPFSIDPVGPAELVGFIIQQENPLRKPVEHRGLLIDFFAFHASESGRQVNAAAPLRPERGRAEQEKQDQTGKFSHVRVRNDGNPGPISPGCTLGWDSR